ncbi:penicillin-binding transpeptidase domain-containing protein [Paenibacillus oryzae]|uniref:penicillin-binding transpeptidase domain-containing protein n=1 Tax=Paenibacillus oryzae TaxID=1844972 RepID=UPI0009EEBA2A|nr:penicillin-binding transpeptidase domain-containing protein [Paenibacillus oryzae]
MIKRIRMRTLLFGGIITLLFLVLIGRIYYWQIVDDYWLDIAKQRWATEETLTAKRGSITDREGNVLAMDTIAYNVSVNPKLINEQEIANEVAAALQETLGLTKDEALSYVTAKNDSGNYYVQREIRKGGWGIDKEKADKLTEANDKLKASLREAKKTADAGIYIQETLKRYYPRNQLASQLVGYVSQDGVNKTGIEAYFDDQLVGQDGYVHYEKDGKWVQLAKGKFDYKGPENGSDVQLTIDSDIQHYVEEALREIVAKYSPKSATAIAADPNTMEILAMANMPDYNPNEYSKYPYANYFNHAVGSLYEPGSTFKIATLAAAVEEGVFDPDEPYQSGSITVPGEPRPIRDHNRKGWGTITFLDGLKYSSNVAFVKLGFERLGADKLRDYFTRFGFGSKTGIELTNELAGRVNFRYNREIADASYGQGVSVTAIQQVAAVAAVANGGRLMEPHVVKSITDPVTQTKTVHEPKLVRQVISEETSRQVSQYLEQVVSDQEKGSGKNAYIEGYRVAGKTGTAQKWINGGYSTTKFLVSFIGYAPVDNPKIVLYVAVDEPNDPVVSGGGAVAAPAFKEIVLKSLRKMGVAPNYISDDTPAGGKDAMISVPDLVDLGVAQAKSELTSKGFQPEFVGNGSMVISQIPKAGSIVHPTQAVYLITEQKQNLAIPDLTGVSLRDALELTSLIGVKLIPEGTGYVYAQQVEEKNGERFVRVSLSPPEGSDAYVPPSEVGEEGADGQRQGEGDSQSEGAPADGEQSGESASAGNGNSSTPADSDPAGLPEGVQGGEN